MGDRFLKIVSYRDHTADGDISIARCFAIYQQEEGWYAVLEKDFYNNEYTIWAKDLLLSVADHYMRLVCVDSQAPDMSLVYESDPSYIPSLDLQIEALEAHSWIMSIKSLQL